MNNIININTATREMCADYALIGVDGENNFEYLVFELDEFIEGNPRLEVIQGTNEYLIDTANFEIEDNQYKLPVKNSMLTENEITMQFCLYNANNELTFKSLKYQMIIAEAINATETIPDEYTTWYENASAKLDAMGTALQQVDNLDIDASKEGNTATVTITNKEGTEKSVNIYDGEVGPAGNGIVNTEKTATVGLVDTYTINYDNGDTDNFDVTNGKDGDDYVITQQDYNAIAGIVENNIQPTISAIQNTADTANSTANTAKSIAEGANQALSYGNYSTMITAFNALDDDVYKIGQNIYIGTLEVPDLWIISVEETSVPYTYTTDSAFITHTSQAGGGQVGYYKIAQLETQKVDLTNYVEFTDTATTSTAGVIKTSGIYATSTGSGGELTAQTKQYSSYDSMSNSAFISKGTLENVITGKGLVNNTDYATSANAGVVKTGSNLGILINQNGNPYIDYAQNVDIDAKSSYRKPIVPAQLPYAVGSVKASQTQSGSAKMWTSLNEDNEIGLNISTE